MKSFLRQPILLAFAAAVFSALPATAQRTEPPEPPSKAGVKVSVPTHAPKIDMWSQDGYTSEKALAVDPNVNISICVTNGNLKVNGWNRNELRVYVKDGSKFGFKVQETHPKTGTPVWVMLNALASTAGNMAPQGECIWGNEIEIDAPTGSVLNIKGKETSSTIDSVRKVNIRMIGGDLGLRNISSGIMASAGQGDITVEESTGPMTLESTTGNIVVFGAGPSEVGDILKAKTNGGAVSMERLKYRQIDVNSISGSVVYTGDLLNGGTYGFRTSNGSIRLNLPQDTKSFVIASYGFGMFSSDIAVKTITETITPGPVKSINGTTNGGGGAELRLTTNNGSISIKKQ